MIVLVMISDRNPKIRDMIRSTWTNPKNSKYLRQRLIQVIFVVGKSEFEVTDTTDDILQVDVKEEYRNLLYKEIIAYNWILDNQKSGFLLKIDGRDTAANLDRLFDQIDFDNENIEIFCHSVFPKPVHRDPIDKWYISNDNYKDDVLPAYCSGPGYMISIIALRQIMRQANFHQPIFIEDIFLTGILSRSAGVSIRDSPNIFAVNFPRCRNSRPFRLTCGENGKVETSVLSAHCFKTDLHGLWRVLQRETCQETRLHRIFSADQLV